MLLKSCFAGACAPPAAASRAPLRARYHSQRSARRRRRPSTSAAPGGRVSPCVPPVARPPPFDVISISAAQRWPPPRLGPTRGCTAPRKQGGCCHPRTWQHLPAPGWRSPSAPAPHRCARRHPPDGSARTAGGAADQEQGGAALQEPRARRQASAAASARQAANGRIRKVELSALPNDARRL